MIRRHSTTVALAAAVAVYLVLFLLLGDAEAMLRILAPALLALLAGIGTKLLLARDQSQIADDAYHDDARALASAVRREMNEVRLLGLQIPDDQARRAVERASTTVPELLERVAEEQPNSLYSSASKFDGHVRSLRGVVEAYLDLTAHPDYYRDAPALAAQGKAAMLRFDEFTIETMQLLTQGDMAEYQANLDTVAPPAIPKLEG